MMRYLCIRRLSFELAKNENLCPPRKDLCDQRYVDYFNSKSWYQGTVDPDTFDAQQGSIFNEYEIANIQKIEEWEMLKRAAGN